jgi:hypothetical protein
MVPGQLIIYLFYCDEMLIIMKTRDKKMSFIFDGQEYWG